MLAAIVASIVENLAEGWLKSLLSKIFGVGAVAQSDTSIAAENGANKVRLEQQEAANEIVTRNAAAAADADSVILRESEQPAPEGVHGATSGLDADPSGHWRD